MRIIIIGGVAGGASAAARARRLDETAEIIVFERGHHPSFANCGMPYYVGGEIESRDKLLVAPIEMLRRRHRLDVRTRCEVTRIDRDNRVVHVRDLESETEYTEAYDKLVIATGAAPIRPPLPGADSAKVLELRDLADADRMFQAVTGGADRALIVGGGFIGLELAENFVRRGLKTTIVERSDQILAPWDPEMVRPLEAHLREQGIELLLGASARAFEDLSDGIRIQLASGEFRDAGFAVMCVGVRPESSLAEQAGIQIGPAGGIVVNDAMQTNDPDVYAVGDVTQVKCAITKANVQIPLAGPANRQGRIAADHIFGRPSTYRGTQATAIVGAFGMTAAMTGLNEKQLVANRMTFEKIYIHPSDHAGYYPGAQPMSLKLLFDPVSGRILGAQCVGSSGVDKRIDVLAVAIQGGMTVHDLEEVELCYAPQYGHAKDPINMAGFVAAGVIRGDQPITHWNQVADDDRTVLIDVRTTKEFEAGSYPGAIHLPIETLRERQDEVPSGKRLAMFCKVGQRGYLATRLLNQKGYDAVNVSGGYKSYLNESTEKHA